jgi:hypothetical protein
MKLINLKERAAYAGARTMAMLFPQFVIKYNTKKEFYNSVDFLPAIKHQIKAVDEMSACEISERNWDPEVYKYIFDVKGIFWPHLGDKEFYNLLDNKNTIIKALKAGVKFTPSQRQLIVNRHGISALVKHEELLQLVRLVINDDLSREHGAEKIINQIACLDELKDLYSNYVRTRTASMIMPAAVIASRIEYIFSTEFLKTSATGTLKHVVYNPSAYADEALWLSLALWNINDHKVFSAVNNKLKNILSYCCRDWSQEVLSALYGSNLMHDFSAKYAIYQQLEQKNFGSLLDGARNLSETFSAYTEFRKLPKCEQDSYAAAMANKIISKMSTKEHGFLYVEEWSYEWFVQFLNKGIFSKEQRTIVLKAIAVGKLMTEEMFEQLSDVEKSDVMRELELLSQFELVHHDSKSVIENKIVLFPEVEEFMFEQSFAVYQKFFEEYVVMTRLSMRAFKTMFSNSTMTVEFLRSYVARYGLDEMDYRMVLQSRFKYLGPEFKKNVK